MLRHLVPAAALFVAPTLASAEPLTGAIGDPALRRKVELVYVEKAEGRFTPPKELPVVNQRGNTYVPHLLPVVANTEVQFTSEDPELHNVFARGGKKVLFNQAQLPKQLFKKTFTELGPVHLTCNIHKEMSAYVMVLQNPYFAVPDKTGAFTIANVPAGTYVVRLWGEKLDDEQLGKKFTVTVGPGAAPLQVASR